MSTVFWFRRDLRLEDNVALAEAAANGPVLGFFNFDHQHGCGQARQSFLVESLRSLDDSIGGRLCIKHGDLFKNLFAACENVSATRVFATKSFSTYSRETDIDIAKQLANVGISVHYLDSPYAVEPGSIFNKTGGPYKVFTPFFRAWKQYGSAEPLTKPNVEWLDGPYSDVLPPEVALHPEIPAAGETEAGRQLEKFVTNSVASYDSQRDQPGVEGTSRLSAYLKWGTLHPRQILAVLDSTVGAEIFRSELCWREFYSDVLYHRPETATKPFVPKMVHMVYDTGPDADSLFDAWSKGQTGYPIVDAGMRQLVETGWMHNRVRMIVASFLTKGLHVDWTRGAKFFMHHLIDGDLASNSHGWQWTAGTGTDASPYFRVFNPTTQSKKFDPEGIYLRRWIPEIAHLSNKHVHEPWKDPNGAPAAYPPPIVDHAEERHESLRRYKDLG